MHIDSKRFTCFLASISALTSLSIDMSLPTVPAIERDFNQSAGSGGLTMSFFLAGYALTPLIGGPLSDRLGRRPVLLASLAFFSASAFACSFSTNFAMLLVFRLLQGCASGIATTFPLAIVRDLVSGSAARQRISEVATINSVMPIVAPLIGSWMMRFGSWRMLFGGQALFAAGIVLALLLGFRETLPPNLRRRLHPLVVIRNYRQLLTNRTFLIFGLINGLTFACMFSFISASPLILMQRMGIGHHAYTLLFAAIAGGTILGALTSATLNRRRIPVHRMLVIGLTLMTGMSVLAWIFQFMGFHRPAALLLPVFAVLFGFGLISPSVNVEALAPVPNVAGSGSGALRSILMIFGSGTSALLAIYCARPLVRAETATTLTMSATAMAAFLLYLGFLWKHEV